METLLKYSGIKEFPLFQSSFARCQNDDNAVEVVIEDGHQASGEIVIQRTEAGESWVPASCEVESRRSNVLLSKKNRRPGFSQGWLTNPRKKNLALQAKNLGTTYKKVPSPNKGVLISKNRNVMNTVQIKRILIPTDFSETGSLALDHAVFMARLLKAQLYLLHVIEVYEYTYSIYEPEVIIQDAAGINDIAQEKLEKLAARISKENGINVNVMVENGKPASEIAAVVKENKIDLIIMGTHGAHGFEEYFIGSNAHKVVNLAPCPVITIQSHAKRIGFSNIVMPIDNSLYSRQKVDYVIRLAHMYDSKVHILGLVHSEDETDERKFNIKLDSVENVLKKADLRFVRKLVKGTNLAEEAMKYSGEVKADLLVIMTDHESNLKSALLGTMARQIVNHSKVPVMSIRPLSEGTIDPVHLSAASPLF